MELEGAHSWAKGLRGVGLGSSAEELMPPCLWQEGTTTDERPQPGIFLRTTR